MHPNPAFRHGDDAALIAWAAQIGFAHLVAATPAGPMVVHAPIVQRGPRSIRFHIARANRAYPYLGGARMIASVTGAEGYISPNWYANGVNQVPTWNYIAVELEGIAHPLDEDGLVEQLDALATAHEPRVNPDNPWTRDKMEEARFRAMLRAIAGFELQIDAVRGTIKLSQNKSAVDRAGVIQALDRNGNAALVSAMQRTQQ